MLTLFTNITEELTELERNVLTPLLLETLLATHSENRFTGKLLCKYLKQCGYDVSESRLRKMVNYIRVTNKACPKVLIGAGNGYFLTNDITIVDDQIKSLEGRVDSMKAVIDSIKSQRANLKFKI
jgi:hypothetical protein